MDAVDGAPASGNSGLNPFGSALSTKTLTHDLEVFSSGLVHVTMYLVSHSQPDSPAFSMSFIVG